MKKNINNDNKEIYDLLKDIYQIPFKNYDENATLNKINLKK